MWSASQSIQPLPYCNRLERGVLTDNGGYKTANGPVNQQIGQDVRDLKISLISLVIKNNLTFAITYYFHFRKTVIMTYLLSLQWRSVYQRKGLFLS